MESASSDIPRRLPRGTHGLDRDVVEASQRTRLLEAVGRAVAERGYAGATIDDVVRRAGVSKKTFYDHFADKQDCFLAAYEAASEELLERVREAHASEDDWLERTRAGIRAYLRWLAADPALARVFLIEVAAAGPLALERREAPARPLRRADARAPRARRARPRRSRSSTRWSRRSTTWSCATSASTARRTCRRWSRCCSTCRWRCSTK